MHKYFIIFVLGFVYQNIFEYSSNSILFVFIQTIIFFKTFFKFNFFKLMFIKVIRSSASTKDFIEKIDFV